MRMFYLNCRPSGGSRWEKTLRGAPGTDASFSPIDQEGDRSGRFAFRINRIRHEFDSPRVIALSNLIRDDIGESRSNFPYKEAWAIRAVAGKDAAKAATGQFAALAKKTLGKASTHYAVADRRRAVAGEALILRGGHRVDLHFRLLRPPWPVRVR